MSLDLTRLEKLCEKGGKTTARCPACAERGGDSQGVHLVVWPDGRFGCAASSGDTLHRKRIWGLVGRKGSRDFVIMDIPSGREASWRSIKAVLWDVWDASCRVTMGKENGRGLGTALMTIPVRSQEMPSQVSQEDSAQVCASLVMLKQQSQASQLRQRCPHPFPSTKAADGTILVCWSCLLRPSQHGWPRSSNSSPRHGEGSPGRVAVAVDLAMTKQPDLYHE